MLTKTAFTTKEISTLLRIHEKTLSYWVIRSVLVPSVYNPSGRGTTRLFSSEDVYEAALVREFTKDELALASIKRLLDVLRNRQFIQDFGVRFSEGLLDEVHLHLVWARNYADSEDHMELVEIESFEQFRELYIDDSEKVTLFNLTHLCGRIFAELDAAGVAL
jgi:DNA-binding transcriptional MerR regulator